MPSWTRAQRRSLALWAVAGALSYTALGVVVVCDLRSHSFRPLLLLHLPTLVSAEVHCRVMESIYPGAREGLLLPVSIVHSLGWGAALGVLARPLQGWLGRVRSPLLAVLLGALLTWLPLQVRAQRVSAYEAERLLSPCNYTGSRHWRICNGCPYRSRTAAALMLPLASAYSLGGWPLVLLEGPLLGLAGLALGRRLRARGTRAGSPRSSPRRRGYTGRISETARRAGT